jgi:hypothetical protein
MPTKDRRQTPAWWTPWLVYILLSLAMTWPLLLHLNTHLLGRTSDIFNVYWGNWWVRKALSGGQNPYLTDLLIYPVGFDLTTFAFSPFLALLWMPLSQVMSAAGAYNIVALIITVLNCVSADRLVRYLTGHAGAALAAGITLGFAPCLATERMAHLNLSVCFWLPWTALLLTRLVREARVRDAILLAVSIGLAFLTRPHVGALVLMFDGMTLIGLAWVDRKRWAPPALSRLLLAGLLVLLITSPLAFHLWGRLNQPGGENLVRGDTAYQQTDLLAYFVPPPMHPFFGGWTEPIYQRFINNASYWAFVGIAPLALALYALGAIPRKALPWAATGLVFVVLALGPCLRFNGRLYDTIKLPYSLVEGALAAIGFNETNRFNLAMMPALATLVGLACARLNRAWVSWAIAGLILFEYLVLPFPLFELPTASPFYDQMASDTEDYAIADLPLKRIEGEVHRYYQTLHHKPIVGGWDHRVPPSAFSFIEAHPLLDAWRTGADAPGAALFPALAALSAANVRYLVLHKDQVKAFPQGTGNLLLTVKPAYQDHSVYVLPTDVDPTQDLYIVHTVAEDIRLVKPVLTLDAEAMALDTCWLLGNAAGTVDGSQVTLTGPGGAVVATAHAAFPSPAQPPACQHWSFALPSSLPPGAYRVDIAPLSGGRALSSYSVKVPIHVVQQPDGTSLALLERPFPIAFDAPIEMLGYRIDPGNDVLWIDMAWRALADHHQSYVLFLQLLHPVTRELVVRTSDVAIQRLDWKAGDVVHEQRGLFIDDIPQGQYELAVGLYLVGAPDRRIAAFDGQDGKPWPGAQAVLDLPVLALPRSLQDTPVSREGRVVVFTASGPGAMQGCRETSKAQIGNIACVLGYSQDPQQARAGQALALTLHWETVAAQPIDGDYTAFVHVLDGASRMVAQHDGKPADGTRPTNTWAPGDQIVDTHELVWLMPGYTGMATVAVGLYDVQTQQRVPAYGDGGERLPDDCVRLGQIQIDP